MNIEVQRKKLDLSSAIAEGDIRVLLMVLVHMTGNERWLQPPYKPKRDVSLIPDPEAGVPKEIQDEIRAAVLKLFVDGEPRPAITDPGDELMLTMMRAEKTVVFASDYPHWDFDDPFTTLPPTLTEAQRRMIYADNARALYKL